MVCSRLCLLICLQVQRNRSDRVDTKVRVLQAIKDRMEWLIAKLQLKLTVSGMKSKSTSQVPGSYPQIVGHETLGSQASSCLGLHIGSLVLN